MAYFPVNYLLPLIFLLAPVLTVVTGSGLTDRPPDHGDALIPKIKLDEKYSIYRKSLSWAEAQIYCEVHEGLLATFYHYDQVKSVVTKIYEISDPLSIDYIKGITTAEFGLDRRYWIGLTDLVAGEGKWFWTGIGKPLVYEAMWYPGQPDHIDSDNNYLGRPEHCVALWNPVFHKNNQHHTFADQECRNKNYFICERNEEKLAAQAKWNADRGDTFMNRPLTVGASNNSDRKPPAVDTEDTEENIENTEEDTENVAEDFAKGETDNDKKVTKNAKETTKNSAKGTKNKTEDTENAREEPENEKENMESGEQNAENGEEDTENEKMGRGLLPVKQNVHRDKNNSNTVGNENKKMQTVLKLAEKLIELPHVRTLLEATDSKEIQNRVKHLEKEILNQGTGSQNPRASYSGRSSLDGRKNATGTLIERTKIKTLILEVTTKPTIGKQTTTGPATTTTTVPPSTTKTTAPATTTVAPSTTTTTAGTTTTTSTTTTVKTTARPPKDTVNKLMGVKTMGHDQWLKLNANKRWQHLHRRSPYKMAQSGKTIPKESKTSERKHSTERKQKPRQTNPTRRKLIYPKNKYVAISHSSAKVTPSKKKSQEVIKRIKKHRHGKHLTTEQPVRHKKHHIKHKHHSKYLTTIEPLGLDANTAPKIHNGKSRKHHKHFLKKMMRLFDVLSDDYD